MLRGSLQGRCVSCEGWLTSLLSSWKHRHWRSVRDSKCCKCLSGWEGPFSYPSWAECTLAKIRRSQSRENFSCAASERRTHTRCLYMWIKLLCELYTFLQWQYLINSNYKNNNTVNVLQIEGLDKNCNKYSVFIYTAMIGCGEEAGST